MRMGHCIQLAVRPRTTSNHDPISRPFDPSLRRREGEKSGLSHAVHVPILVEVDFPLRKSRYINGQKLHIGCMQKTTAVTPARARYSASHSASASTRKRGGRGIDALEKNQGVLFACPFARSFSFSEHLLSSLSRRCRHRRDSYREP